MLGKQFSSLTVPMRVHHFEKEMKDRTAKWVEASRSASQFLHSSAVLDDAGAYGIDGMASDDSRALLALLAEKGITAAECEDESLERKVLAEYARIKT